MAAIPSLTMMRQTTLVVLFSLLTSLTASLSAQKGMTDAEFQKAWKQGMDLEDPKLLDKAMSKGSMRGLRYFESLWFTARNGNSEFAETNCQALMDSWERCFKNRKAMEELQRWVDGCTTQSFTRLKSIRDNSYRLWTDYADNVSKHLVKKDYQGCFDDFMKLAKAAESMGHYLEASEQWELASFVGSKMPGKTLEERESVVFALEQCLACRDRWGYGFGEDYIKNKEFVKAELDRIKEKREQNDKRKKEGYDVNAKGIDSLLMPNAVAKKFPLTFEGLKDWTKDFDYGPKGGMVPPFWWQVSLTEVGSGRQMNWFEKVPLYLVRTGGNKFAINFTPDEAGEPVRLDVGARAKPSTFFLDKEQKQPYSMFFWLGSDQESVGVTKGNYAPTSKLANIHYRSASSWQAQVDKETIVYYDDDASGQPGNAEPFQRKLKSHLVGDARGEGVEVPLFDSMEVGKGKRVPFSKFVKLADGWHYQEIESGADVSFRPLNPEYVKTGKVKMTWKGPKPTAPVQLVIQGKGDFDSAIFDIAGGKEVEVPIGEYRVIWGRVSKGKGARVQSAELYPADGLEPFYVEPDKTLKLEMGAPFKLEFAREGDKNASIDALSIHVRDSYGLRFVGLHGTHLACDVLAAADESGKGKKEVGEFTPFVSDPLMQQALAVYNNLGFLIGCFPLPKGYKEGEMVLKVELPKDGMKLGLFIKKHKFFGKLETVWK